jgi:hypothetical protein
MCFAQISKCSAPYMAAGIMSITKTLGAPSLKYFP